MPFLSSSRQAIVLAVLLLCGIGIFYGMPAERPVNLHSPLTSLRVNLPGWSMLSESPVEKEVEDVLRADETLVRDYANSSTGERASLFIAFFRSQSTGAAPHSPKNCLPGAGWIASHSDIIQIPVGGPLGRIPVNRYVVSKGESKAVVLYWYQSHNRVVASEYSAKIYLVYDSMRWRRSDTSIVRVVVPIISTEEQAEQTGIGIVKGVLEPIRNLLPA